MSSGQALLERLYEAFGRADGPAMAACYAPDARFSDPLFPELRGAAVGAMWRMLTGRAQGLRIEVRELEANEDRTGRATWLATYQFGPARRPVANLVHSSFDLADGLIAVEQDTFDFHAWAAQALGAKGRLLGWTPMVRSAVRAEAAKGLEAFIAAEST